MDLITNIRGSYKHIPYTWKHYIAFLKTEKKLLGYYRYKFHDWDKLIMYIFIPWIGVKSINKLHRIISSHHPSLSKDWVDYTEAIIDWECARLTKPDKPLNARETMEAYYSEFREEIEPVLERLGL